MTSSIDALPVSVRPDGEKRCIILWPRSASDDHQQRLPGPIDLVAPLEQFLLGLPGDCPAGGTGDPAIELSGIILDLDGVDYINSAGIGSIFALRKYAKDKGAELVVSRPRATISRLLETVNLPALIPVTADLEEARKQLDKSDGA